MPDGFDATFVILPEGMSVTSVDHTGPGEYVITISGVTSQGSIPIRVRRPGAAPVPAIRSVVLYFDSAAPVLAADGWARPAVNEGSVGFTSSEPGTLYYMVTGVGDTAPTASEVAATGTAGPMLEGLNTVALNGSVLTSGAARTVYVVAEDGDGNLSALLPLPLGPFSGLTVEAGEGGTAGASASGLAEGDTTELWATAGPGYQFAGWTVLSGGDASVLLDDPEVAAAVLTMPGNNVTVKALFTKTVLDVVFILNAPAAAEDAPGTGWPKHGSAKIGELVAGTPSAGGLTDYRFTGWHTTVYGVDEADPDKAWVFAEDVVTAAMINAVGGGQVVLYGAWESRWGDVMYAVGGTDAYPASPAAVGPDRVEVGSVVVDAPGYSTVLSRPGFTFGGWYLDSEFVDPVTDTSLVTAGGVDLHAYWVALEDVTYHVKHYLVAHDASRQLAATETLQGRPGVMSPEATARDFAGYVFNSADSEVQGTISAGMVLELVYDAVPVAVVFTPGAGSSTEPWTEIGYFYGDLVSEPDDPSWAGHAFLGWESSQVGDWAFAADRLTQSNGVALADGVAGQIGLSGVWAGGPEAQGAETMVALGGTALLEGSVDVDTAHEVTVEDAKVTTEAAWLDVAEVTPGLDGSVVFAAKSLEAGVYAFTVRFEDSNGLTADAVYSVTVVAPPQVSGETAARIPEGGEAGFELVVESVAAPLDVEATAVPPGADVEAEVPGADGAAAVSFAANDLVGGVYEFWVTYTDKLGQASSGTKLVVTVQAAPTGQGRNTNLADDREVGSVTPLDDVTGTNLEELTNESFTATEHGTLVLVDGGVIEYTPDTGWEGIDEFTVTVCDDLDQCVELDYSFTVLDVYVAPVAPQVTGAQGVVRVGGKITLAGQVEVDPVYGPAVVSAELVTVEPWMDRASIELDVAGSVEFGAGTLPVGEYTFTVRFTDSNGLFGDAAYTVTVMDRPLVTGLASARIAVGGQAQFELDVADGVTIGSAVASRVPDGDGVEVLADDAGGVLFRAGSLEAGTYGFDVTYADGVDESTQVVGFTVVIQAEPTGEGKDVQVPNDLTPVTVDPLGDTTGEYLVPLTAGSWSGPDKGSLALVGGKVRYTPLVGWMGTDEFTVTVCDDLEQCVELTYTVSVLSIWSPLVPPEAIGAEDVVALGGTVVLDGHVTPDTAHAVTIDQAELVTVDPWVEDASVEVFASGEVRFDAGSLEPGVYEFVVRYTDSESATVDATFKVEVIGLPTVSGDGALTVALGGTGELGLTVGSRVQIDSGTASDVPEGLGVTVTASGQVRVDAGGLPAGQYEFLVSFTDELGQASEPFPVEVSVQAPPQGQGRVFEVADDLSAVAVDVAGDVSGTGLISLTAGNITQPVHGKVLVTGSLAVSYVPAPGWAGQDPFTVRVCDGVGQCVDLAYVADVLDTVAGPVLPIIAIGASGVVGVGGAVELVGAVHADGEHGVTVTGATVVVGVAGAGIVADVAGRVLFNAGTAAAGTYEFTVRFTDSAGQQADAVYRVAVVDALLVSGDTSARVPVGGSHVFRLAVEDSATLADVTVEGAPADGSVTAGADGNVEFEAGSVAEGVYGFRVKFTDELNQVSQVVAFEVTVQGPPVAATDTERAKVRAGGRLLFPEDVSSRFGWVASRSIVTPPAAGTAKLGSVIYDATGAAAGEYPFVVEYTDDLGQSARVTYIPVVQWAPSGTGRRIVVPDDRTPVLVDVFGDVTGAGLRALSAGSITQADHGVVTVTGVGQVRYLPALGWSGATSFSVQVCDDLNQCVTLTYAVDVKSVKPLPPCVPDTPDSPDSPSNPGGSGAGAGAGAGGGGSGVPGDELPFTGFDVWAVMGPALDLVIAGILLLLAARVPRRRRRA
ncbi:MAG: InlB B-repeat-containing protein [Bifidobacteriaceae bacterium]|jgi:hypothetical protein|nr:InlB B-repeat-containing protein [Bifidobacteriaceae bacterium]